MDQPLNPPPGITPPAAKWNTRSGRRNFLKSTGKAGAVTILALHGLKVEVCAETPSGPPGM